MTTEKASSRRPKLSELALKNGSQAQSAKAIDPSGVHAGLWLDKYIEHLKRDAKTQDNKRTPQQALVKEVASLAIPDVYRTYYKRWVAHLKEIGAQTREAKTRGRMAVGLGNEGVLETSVALHRTYGVPYIPGSALKGLAASYARLLAGDEWKPDPGKEAYQTVFGDTNSAGFVIFFDALYIPLEKRQSSQGQASGAPEYPLHTDIITVHHPDYYKGTKVQGKLAAPADWDSPNPVPFLSATGSYLIALAAPDLAAIEPGLDKKWIEKTLDLLNQALLVLGIGAKTSSGYGRMEVEPGLTAEDEAELLAIEEYLEKIRALSGQQISSPLKNLYYKLLKVKSPAARKRFANAIIEKVRSIKKEPDFMREAWYRDTLKRAQ